MPTQRILLEHNVTWLLKQYTIPIIIHILGLYNRQWQGCTSTILRCVAYVR